MKRVRHLDRVLLVALGTVVGLAGAELLIRVTNGARYEDRPIFYPYHVDLGWAPAAHVDHTYYGGDYSIHINTDEEGNRLGRLGDVPEQARRVILLGDSYVFGWGVSTEETLASQLDELVAPDSSRVVNLGVSGYGTSQSALSFDAYLEAHPSAPVEAIVVLHSHNDPADNVIFASVQRGLREYVEAPRNRGLHLHNLVRLVTRAVGRGSREGLLPGGHRDFLWTVGPVLTDEGLAVELTESAAAGSVEELMSSEQELIRTYERGDLTRLQRGLLEQSINRINELGSARGARVLHTAIHDAPSWYVGPIEEMVQKAHSRNSLVVWCGVVPALHEYSGQMNNDHSGSHFTPELNGYYARKFAAWLERDDCGD